MIHKFVKSDYEQIVTMFTFLYPRNVWNGELVSDYDYTWCVGVDELPQGWMTLFLLFCKHLKVELDKFYYTDEFMFTQVKEKYGSMRLYNNGYPKDSSVENLHYIFEHLSTYVCQVCGEPATFESTGWICQLCDEHRSDNCVKKDNKEFKVKIKTHHADGTDATRTLNCSPYWKEYLKCLKMSKEELLDYILYDIV